MDFQIIESGTYDALLGNSGEYARLWKLQAQVSVTLSERPGPEELLSWICDGLLHRTAHSPFSDSSLSKVATEMRVWTFTACPLSACFLS